MHVTKQSVQSLWMQWVVMVGIAGLSPTAKPVTATEDARFTRLTQPPTPKIVVAAEAFSGSYSAENILKPPTPGGHRSEYASRGLGGRTFIDFDFGQPVRLAAFRHIQRHTPDTIAEATLIFNEAVEPRLTAAPKVTEGPVGIQVPGFKAIRLPRARTVLFENGHRLVFDIDLARARDWIAADGTHLLYPKPYGNAIDLAELDDLGLAKPLPATAERPAAGPSINLDYRLRKGQMAVTWVGHTISANRITLEYRIPLAGLGVP